MFYVSLVSRGIFCLHKHIGNNAKHQNWAIDQTACYTVHICEALDSDTVLVGSILPERVPICLKDKEQLKEYQYRQYFLLDSFLPLKDFILSRQAFFEPIRSRLEIDEDKYQCFLRTNVNLRRDAPKNELHIATQYKHIFEGDIISYYIRPLKIFKWMLKEPNVSHCYFDTTHRRWFAHAHYEEAKTAKNIVHVEE